MTTATTLTTRLLTLLLSLLLLHSWSSALIEHVGKAFPIHFVLQLLLLLGGCKLPVHRTIQLFLGVQVKEAETSLVGDLASLHEVGHHHSAVDIVGFART